MGKIFEQIKEKIKYTGTVRDKDKTFQQKVGKNAMKFIGILLICAFISRGMYGAALPKVEITYAQKASMDRKLELEGQIIENKEIPIIVKNGILIESIPVKEGEEVVKDTPILQLNLDDLKNLIREKEYELDKLSIQIETLTQNRQIQQAELEKMKIRAAQDYQLAQNKTDEQVAKAGQELEASRQKLANLPSKDAYLKQKLDEDGQYQSLTRNVNTLAAELEALKQKLEASGGNSVSANAPISEELKAKESALQQAQRALESYRNQSDNTSKEQWDAIQKQLNEEIKNQEKVQAQTNLERQENMLSENRKVEDANAYQGVDSTLELALLQSEKEKEELSSYQTLYKQKGIILADREGTVTKVNALPGERTGDQAAMLLADRESGYCFRANLSKDEKKHLKVGDEVTLTMDSTKQIFTKTIESIEESKVENDEWEIFFSVEKEAGNIGEQGTITANSIGDTYETCVLLEALHGTGNQPYILLVYPRDTILGEELVAEKKNVILLDQNDTYAAIEAGGVDSSKQIILRSGKPISQGDTVRLFEP